MSKRIGRKERRVAQREKMKKKILKKEIHLYTQL